MKPKNLLILLSDEHARRSSGCYGHPVVQTPNIDKLAARGVRFTQAHTPSPICVSARASLATGQWVHQHGCWDSAQAYSGQQRSWAHELRDAGYHVASIGKLHFRGEQDDDNGFSEEVLPMHILDSIGWVQGLLRRDPLPYEDASDYADDIGVGESGYTHYDRKIRDAACHWLKQREESNDDKPWVLFVSFVSPHYPLTAPEEFHALYENMPDSPPEIIGSNETQHPVVNGMAEFFNYHDYFDEDKIRKARQAYYALCSYLDDNIGSVIDAVGSNVDNTRIMYTTDHGEMLGNHGFWAKSHMYEDSVGIPMLFAGPDIPKGRVVDHFVNLVDVFPTALDCLGVSKTSTELPGISLFDTINEVQTHNTGFSEYHDGGSITGIFMLRMRDATGDWKYVHYVDHPAQLFDLAADPDEHNDLAQLEEYRPIVEACLLKLQAIAHPEQTNARAFADQAKLIEHYGGREGISRHKTFNYTPLPKGV